MCFDIWSRHLGCWGQNTSPHAQGCDLSWTLTHYKSYMIGHEHYCRFMIGHSRGRMESSIKKFQPHLMYDCVLGFGIWAPWFQPANKYIRVAHWIYEGCSLNILGLLTEYIRVAHWILYYMLYETAQRLNPFYIYSNTLTLYSRGVLQDARTFYCTFYETAQRLKSSFYMYLYFYSITLTLYSRGVLQDAHTLYYTLYETAQRLNPLSIFNAWLRTWLRHLGTVISAGRSKS